MKKRIKQKGLSFYLKIKLLDGKVISRRSPIKRKILLFSKAGINEFKWIYLRVTYKPSIYNDGKYYTYEDFLNAWKSFTAEKLINEAINY